VGTKKDDNQLYEVEIKSQSLLKEEKKGFIIYFRGGTHQQIGKNVMKLYPSYTKPEDKPMINITPISEEEYTNRVMTGVIKQQGQLIEGRAHIYDALGN